MFHYLCRHMGPFRQLTDAISEYLRADRRVLSVADIVEVMEAHGFGRLAGQRTYAVVRFARSIVLADGRRHADSPADWRVLRSMSAHVSHRLRAWAIWEHPTAIEFRDGMRQILRQPNYTFLDLVVYTCLLQGQ